MKRKSIRMHTCLAYAIKNTNSTGCLLDLFDHDVISFPAFQISFRVITVIYNDSTSKNIGYNEVILVHAK